MLGRTAYQQPWILTALELALFATEPPPISTVLRGLQHYIDQVVAAGHAPGHVLRHVLGLFQSRAGARRFRQLLTGVRDWREGAVLREAAAAVGIDVY
jgi:tRNA-dihydrouridine synthase A